ncbi:hypothetical protein SISNIDRAFT_523239 [Sistotremastrum niveocremeum HHB9708]|uniref:Ankyrin n=1 Tax=Sistotremastrum niveocremeum HHB9708 TaxID=1314777 RepID=A0A164ZNZ2_9AGAM|nr:hypothetical protein SISNIDRAFT_523239 [Sistotremastrum niveocremeum HHB9708]
MPDFEDKEGETALHKASLNGHLPVVKFLLTIPERAADVHAQDADGWTALHNACSKGYLDIVRYLCENAGAAEEVPHSDPLVRGIDRKSNGGWTPLMNAASKGNLPVVLYLLNKQNADPLVRNNWGETAYDVAAAVFEVWICEMLAKAEAERWSDGAAAYRSLAIHTTVPLILYENQRLDGRYKTLALSGGRPKFSTLGLGRKGRPGQFQLQWKGLGDPPSRDPFTWRSDVQLPFLHHPFEIPLPDEAATRSGAERSHFWLSDWTLDLTDPKVDTTDGWQYATAFDEADDRWVAQPPPALERLLFGTTTGSQYDSTQSSGASSSTTRHSPYAWVRRRRWVRVMRRRLDIPPLPFLGPDGAFYNLTEGGALSLVSEDIAPVDEEGGVELGAVAVTPSHSFQDYVSHARYLAGNHHTDMDDDDRGLSAKNARRIVTELERAVTELQVGISDDHDVDRRTQAEVLLNVYSRELERRKIALGAQNHLSLDQDSEAEDEDEDDDDDFQYTGASSGSPTAPHNVSFSSRSTDYFSNPTSSRPFADLTPHLIQAPEFRVPTHEAPQKVGTPQWNLPTPHPLHAQWDRDETASHCKECKRRFTFLLRKHHCRKCGHIFCDRCSASRVHLEPSDVVRDPGSTPTEVPHTPDSLFRVCQSCHDLTTAGVSGGLQGLRTSSIERIVVDHGSLTVPRHNRDRDSIVSDLAECPVCNQNLDDLGPPSVQEAHVKTCLEGGSGKAPAPKYLVYKLPGESTLIGVECVICLEEFTKGSLVARLSCLCTFHSACLTAWLQRGRSCPVHARDV